MSVRHAATTSLALALTTAACSARPPADPPLHAAGVTERLGARVPPGLRFQDVDGRTVRFGDVGRDAPAIVLVLAYFRCRTLCSTVLDGTARALRGSGLEPGTDFQAVTVSIDPRDTPEDALTKRAHALAALGAPATPRAWTFLLGEDSTIHALADAVGFEYRYDPDTDQYAHPAVMIALTPEGTVSGYLYGVEPRPAEVTALIAAAAEGRTRATINRVLLRCFRFIPALRRHARLITGMLWTGAALTIVALGALLVRLWWRELAAERCP